MGYRVVYSDDFLAHHGVKGQKWGIRRYQNEDGTLTNAGKLRYIQNPDGSYKKLSRRQVRKNVEATRNKKIKELQKVVADDEARIVKSKAYKDYIKKYPELAGTGDVMGQFQSAKGYHASRDADVLRKDYARGHAGIVGIGSSIFVAPFVGLATKAVTGSEKKAAIAALASVGALSALAYKSGRDETKEAEIKYGLRAKDKKYEKSQAYDKAYDKASKTHKNADVVHEIAKVQSSGKANTPLTAKESAKLKELEKGYSKGFMDYVKKPEQLGSRGLLNLDDNELLDLMAMEYEENTGKSARAK